MDLLENKILKDGEVKSGNVIKVDSFMNHRVEPNFINKLGQEIAQYFNNKQATLVLTLEASGIPLAYACAEAMNIPLIFAKKTESLNLDDSTYVAEVYSYTRQNNYKIKVSKRYINGTDKVVIIDDFLARGNACKGMINICEQAKAEVVGIGIGVEKYFQSGGRDLRELGYDLFSLAIIEFIDENGNIIFKNDY